MAALSIMAKKECFYEEEMTVFIEKYSSGIPLRKITVYFRKINMRNQIITAWKFKIKNRNIMLEYHEHPHFNLIKSLYRQ